VLLERIAVIPIYVGRTGLLVLERLNLSVTEVDVWSSKSKYWMLLVVEKSHIETLIEGLSSPEIP
jgi:hypothetical protein